MSQPMSSDNLLQDLDSVAMADVLDTGNDEAGDAILLDFLKEDEGLFMFLDKKFSHHHTLKDIPETVAIQAVDEYFANHLSNEASSGAENHLSQPPDDPVEIGVPDDMQRCRWVDEVTNQMCPALVPNGLKPMLSHLSTLHSVCGSETMKKECRWAVVRSGGESPCGTTFQRRNTPRHMAKHLRLRYFCKLCDGKSFARSDLLKLHVRKDH